MALISEYLAADLSAVASADALGRINIGKSCQLHTSTFYILTSDNQFQYNEALKFVAKISVKKLIIFHQGEEGWLVC